MTEPPIDRKDHTVVSRPPVAPTGLVEAPRCVTLPAIPVVYGLEDPDDGVQSWVLALPGGQALIVPSQGEATGLVHTTVDRVVRWWAPFWGAELVLVTNRGSDEPCPSSRSVDRAFGSGGHGV